jgi:MerR family copper efflux transcriptional regulator
MKPLLVGEVARAVGVGVQTLHFYEREGLIPPPARSVSGYRLYNAREIDRIRFIRKAQALGLPLHEIRQVLALAARGTSPCRRVQAALAETLADVDRRLAELQCFRDALARLTESGLPPITGDAAAQICAIVEGCTPVLARCPDGLRSRRVIQAAHD